MRVSTSAYYAWINNPDRPDRRKEESDLKKKIKQIFYEHKQVYGSRRISDALSKLDIKAGRYKVRRLMSELGLKVRYPKLLHIIMIMNTHSYDREHLLYSRIGSDVFLL